MNIKKLKTNGFALFEGILLVVVIGVIVVIGLQVKKRISVLADTELAGQTPGILCQGSGTDGLRHQAVYAKLEGNPDNSIQSVATIKSGAAKAERAFRVSANKNGGGVRHLRWVTDASCKLSVINITLPNNDTPLRPEYLRAAGLTAPNRKYVVWLDRSIEKTGVTLWADPDNSGQLTYSTINKNAWESDLVVAHEIMHGLGGAPGSSDSYKMLPSNGAPHSTGESHCTDWGDLMCYVDSGPNRTITTPCPGQQAYALFDCNGDDYYSTAPRSGSWLALHPERNGALSPYLATTGQVGQPNDYYWDRKVLSAGPQTVNGSNTGATAQYREQAHAGNSAKRSIWYEWSPSTAGNYTIKTYTSTSVSSFDTVLAVYTGADDPIIVRNVIGAPTSSLPTNVGELRLQASNDNFEGRTGSRVRFNAVVGTKYKIAIDGKNGASGNTVLSIIRQ